MAKKRKIELLAWLRDRQKTGLISKQEMQQRINLIEANEAQLLMPETAK